MSDDYAYATIAVVVPMFAATVLMIFWIAFHPARSHQDAAARLCPNTIPYLAEGDLYLPWPDAYIPCKWMPLEQDV